MARKIVIASGKGGAGKSSLAAGLGGALAGMGKHILLIDCDIGLRSFGFDPRMRGKHSLRLGGCPVGPLRA